AGPNPASRINFAIAIRQPEFANVGAQSVDDADRAGALSSDRQPLAPRFAFAEFEVGRGARRDPSRIQMLVVRKIDRAIAPAASAPVVTPCLRRHRRQLT